MTEDFDFDIFLWVAGGVLISIVLPIFRSMLPKSNAVTTAGVGGFLPKLWGVTKPYIAVLVVSLLVSLLVVAFMADQLTDWRVALLAGYASDSTIQKLKG